MLKLSAHNSPAQWYQCAPSTASHQPARVAPFPVGVRSRCRSLF
jgi:hypothetical protein